MRKNGANLIQAARDAYARYCIEVPAEQRVVDEIAFVCLWLETACEIEENHARELSQN